MTELRSLSYTGVAQVTLVFRDGTDIYRARQLTAERLAAVRLPGGLVPELGPITTGLGDIYFYAVQDSKIRPGESAPDRLARLRSFHEWTIEPRLR